MSEREPRPINNLSGRKFGRLLVLRVSGYLGRTIAYDCLCACGADKRIRGSNLSNGHTQSCGCVLTEALSRPRAHGKNRTPEHLIWKDMRRRCRSKTNSRYADYGGRGIAVCERWNDFALFLADMGPRPSATHSIERRDNDGNYEPDNCRWATPVEQANNKRSNRNITIGALTLTVEQWNRKLGFPNSVLRKRLWRGWSVEHAMTTPIGVKRGASQ